MMKSNQRSLRVIALTAAVVGLMTAGMTIASARADEIIPVNAKRLREHVW